MNLIDTIYHVLHDVIVVSEKFNEVSRLMLQLGSHVEMSLHIYVLMTFVVP